MRDWPKYGWKKFLALWRLVSQVNEAAGPDHRLYRDYVTYATFHAAARYDLKPYRGRLLNVIASRRPLADPAVDTRLAFSAAAGDGSRTVTVAAEDSGRLFVSPHVQELARHLAGFLNGNTLPNAGSPAGSDGEPSQAA